MNPDAIFQNDRQRQQQQQQQQQLIDEEDRGIKLGLGEFSFG